MVRQALMVITAAAALLSCGASTEDTRAKLPPIPEIETTVFPAAARSEIESGLEALRAAPTDLRRNADLAMLAHAYQQYAAAEALYRRTAALEPSAFRWLYYLGVTQEQQGKAEEAADALRAAAAIDAEYLPLQRRLAETLVSLNQLEEAREIYLRLLEENPDDAAARYGLGRVRALQGDSADAVSNLEEAIRIFPAYSAAHYELSLAYRDLGRTDEAARHLAIYERNERQAPPSNDPLMAAVNALNQGVTDYISRAVKLEARGDLQGAIDQHLEALAVDPGVAQTHVNLVSLYGRTRDFDRAAEHYRKALEINPDQADLHYNFGVLLFGAERYGEAKAAFEKAIESNPDYAAAHNNLGQLLEQEGRIDAAMERYGAAIRARPGYRLARFHLGRMLLAKRRPGDAAVQFEQALEPRDEMTPQILFALAAAKAQLGDRTGALRRGEEAQALARELGQHELAARLEQDLRKLR